MSLLDDLVRERFGADAAREVCQISGLFEHDKLYRRVEISDTIRDEFVKRGGDATTTRDAVALVLKRWLLGSTSPFRKEQRGRYRFVGTSGSASQIREHGERGSEEDALPGSGLRPVREMGEGLYEVYAWYLPQYEHAAGGRWPIKIGRAGPDGLRRRLRDFQENIPERPCYLFRFGCANDREARDLESLLHAWFRTRGRNLEDVPGEEWFDTNPSEIAQAYRAIKGQ